MAIRSTFIEIEGSRRGKKRVGCRLRDGADLLRGKIRANFAVYGSLGKSRNFPKNLRLRLKICVLPPY